MLEELRAANRARWRQREESMFSEIPESVESFVTVNECTLLPSPVVASTPVSSIAEELSEGPESAQKQARRGGGGEKPVGHETLL